MRRKKVNPSDGNARVDFVDASGDSWQEYPVLHPKFKEWLDVYIVDGNKDLNKQEIEDYFKQSPWYRSCANDIAWEARVELQAIIQRFTTNAISSTMNLPSDVSKETVSNIYFAAWKKGLKGITIYRDGCRTGVLVAESSKKPEEFTYTDAIKRPKSLEADLHITSAKGKKYAVIVGLFGNHPYEVFAFEASPEVSKIGNLKGKVVKVKRGHYNFLNGEADHTIKDLQIIPETGEEQTLTRLVSGMLRHGAKPDFVAQQIDKCELGVVSFGKAVSRILNKYTEKKAQNEACPECHQEALVKEEGCTKCRNCGYSKC
jgi:ribonucleoside-diphosphate reductase alpha chain